METNIINVSNQLDVLRKALENIRTDLTRPNKSPSNQVSENPLLITKKFEGAIMYEQMERLVINLRDDSSSDLSELEYSSDSECAGSSSQDVSFSGIEYLDEMKNSCLQLSWKTRQSRIKQHLDQPNRTRGLRAISVLKSAEHVCLRLELTSLWTPRGSVARGVTQGRPPSHTWRLRRRPRNLPAEDTSGPEDYVSNQLDVLRKALENIRTDLTRPNKSPSN
ncbi:hypothetical protein HW555_005641 [Spodoptera exigua]|uniref:Uncharacterized protein n=1 Tax=Spodoptera exigua TaxID=7107 RepID=A0A835GG53_SPOEX|nr:hypothetical protein HW555_005641 [Spodoptera exigua]